MNKDSLIKIFIISFLIIFSLGAILLAQKNNPQDKTSTPSEVKIIPGSIDKSKLKTEEEWKSILTPEQYNILREAGTETPFTGELEHEKRIGTYYSVGCKEPVFHSKQKYDSGTGWPSFWNPINPDALVLKQDTSIPGGERIEVLDKCGGHLGHVFDDGPNPTGKRYCINSTALYFIPDKH